MLFLFSEKLYADARMTILNTTHSSPIIEKESWDWEGAIIRSGTESGGKLSECTDKRVCVCGGGQGELSSKKPSNLYLYMRMFYLFIFFYFLVPCFKFGFLYIFPKI
jgi:hypothetical protein